MNCTSTHHDFYDVNTSWNDQIRLIESNNEKKKWERGRESLLISHIQGRHDYIETDKWGIRRRPFSQHQFWLIIAWKAQVLLVTLTMALFYSSVSVNHGSVTVSQREQNQHPESVPFILWQNVKMWKTPTSNLWNFSGPVCHKKLSVRKKNQNTFSPLLLLSETRWSEAYSRLCMTTAAPCVAVSSVCWMVKLIMTPWFN